jgi:hypothetical protein
MLAGAADAIGAALSAGIAGAADGAPDGISAGAADAISPGDADSSGAAEGVACAITLDLMLPGDACDGAAIAESPKLATKIAVRTPVLGRFISSPLMLRFCSLST